MSLSNPSQKARTDQVPVIDVSALIRRSGDEGRPADEIGKACRDTGFFYIAGHGVSEELRGRLDRLARRFFALDLGEKMKIRMELGGRAWRGYFPVGGELTSGKPDMKEGLYLGTELGEGDPRVRAGVPLHGPNLFPEGVPAFRETVLEYMAALTEVGHALMRGVALSLGLEAEYFRSRYTGDPLTLFRIFRYPPVPAETAEPQWGVGEHTDYGMLTILMQDDVGGLQVKSRGGWIDAPPVPGTFVCNIGDMLDRMTRGLYRSTPHRVRNVSGRERFSFPFFFDPGWDARVRPIELPGPAPEDDRAQRWDQASVHAFDGTYGDYILSKVAKVFPELARGTS
jgi:isopenicillin N synthase-like dioxygenase